MKLVLGKKKKSYIYLECCMPLVDGKKEPTHSIDIRKISSKQTTHVSILQFCLLFAFYTDVETHREGKREVE